MNNYLMIGLGGSCHWCTEAVFQSLKGVVEVEQGWISSEEITSFSEAVIVHFDPSIISPRVIIEVHLHSHSCTSQHSMREKYRSAVYTFNESQRNQSIELLEELQIDFLDPIVTKVLKYKAFKLNKEDYLNYYKSNPEKAFCRNVISPKLQRLMKTHSKYMKFDFI